MSIYCPGQSSRPYESNIERMHLATIMRFLIKPLPSNLKIRLMIDRHVRVGALTYM